MLRYRIVQQENGRYVVLPAVLSVVSIEETYANRSVARETADWLNRLEEHERQQELLAPVVQELARSA